MADPFSKLQEQVSCPVCLDIFTQPKLLACNHAFCKQCIDQLPVDVEEEKQIVKCPLCCERTTLPQHDAANLPPAFYINILLELHQTAPKVGQEKCVSHDRLLEMYCTNCNQLVCTKCFHSDHCRHEGDYITDLLAKHQQEVKSHLVSVKEQEHAIRDVLDNITAEERVITQHGESIKNEIDTFIAEIIAILQKSGQKLKANVEALTKHKLSKIARQKEYGEMLLTMLTTCVTYVEDKLQYGPDQEILLQKNEMIDRLRVVKNAPNQMLELTEKSDIAFQRNCELLEKCKMIGEVCVEGDGDIASIIEYYSNISANSQCHSGNTPEATKHSRSLARISKRRNIATSTGTNPVSHQTKFQPVRIIRGLHMPRGIAITHNGLLLVAEYDNETVAVLDKLGCTTKRFRHQQASGVCLAPDNHILILSSTAPHITKYTMDYTVVGTSGAVACYYPQGIAASSSGHMYVCNVDNHNIQVFNPDLTLSCEFGTEGSGPGQFQRPWDIAIDSKDTIYVCDCGNMRIQRLLSNGRFIGEFEVPAWPHSIAIDYNDVIYITDEDTVAIYNDHGHRLCSFCSLGCSEIAVNKQGHVCVCNSNNEVVIYSSIL